MTPLSAALCLSLGALAAPSLKGDVSDGLKMIDEDQVEAHLRYLASPALEGRDSPSRGLMLAAQRVASVFESAGLAPTSDSLATYKGTPGDLPGLEGQDEPPAWSIPEGQAGTYLRPFQVSLPVRGGALQVPNPEKCLLQLEDGEEPVKFTFGDDFVPLNGHAGGVRGELVWVGFGIQSRKLKYDSLARLDLAGKIALLVEGDPQAGKNFEGPELTAEASIHNKLGVIEEAGAIGAIVVRREPAKPDWMKQDPAPAPLGYRYTWASWNPPSRDRDRGASIPVIEVTLACASALAGTDVESLVKKIDRGGTPQKVTLKDRRVAFESALDAGQVTLPNVVGILPGRDPALRDQFVIVGAHMDHIGVGVRGRIGFGADDNASGTSAMLEIVEAMSVARPRRSVIFCAFSGEEDGLLGSKEIAKNLPVPRSQVVAMVNLDMIGRGEASESFCLGFQQNPAMEKIVGRAQDLGRTGVKRIRRCDDAGLFLRSDHHPFHEVGLPTVFFFENYPLEQNRDYHTWRDTFEGVDIKKVTNTARLAFCTAWLLAEDDDTPPPPKG